MNDEELARSGNRVVTRSDFVRFVELLREDLHANERNWENTRLEDFLEVIAACTSSLAGYKQNVEKDLDIENLSWNLMAQILLAARVYE